MFTGIVEERGEVASLDGTDLTVRCALVTGDAEIGRSIAVNGVCLTVVERGTDHLSFGLSTETLARTSLGGLSTGDPVNLERPATLVSRLGGHLVQGHVDGTAVVTAVQPDAWGGVRLSVRLAAGLLRSVVEQGSIALDGVSLTVAAIDGEAIEVALIPHTLAVTTLGSVAVGDLLNVEVDVIAKYVATHLERVSGATPAGERPAVHGSTTDPRRDGDPQEERSA